MNNRSWWNDIYAALLLCAATTFSSPAQTFTTLVDFNGTNGAEGVYNTSLVQGFDGNLYGTTGSGGATGQGTVFKITPGGSLTILYSFDGSHGVEPLAGLFQTSEGNFYGTTYLGGAHNNGTVFEITPGGTLTTLHSFDYTDGNGPFAGVVQTIDGHLYGTTSAGGPGGGGTVFEATPRGELTTIYAFSFQQSSVGAEPFGLTAADGKFYGATYEGDGYGSLGTIFQITHKGNVTTLYSFSGPDGGYPYAGLLHAGDGDFCGTTAGGGASSQCAFGCGTVFKVTREGALTTLHSFSSADGAAPEDELVLATDGNFYGTTFEGGTNNYGTIFKLTPEGNLTSLHSFDFTDGAYPLSGLVQCTDGNLYGATSEGGNNDNCLSYGCGTIFRLSMGLGPFVKTLPSFGEAGDTIHILGTDLTGATSVTFNGTPAAFTILSPTAMTATVPSGATRGKIQVTTPSGTLLSNVPFLVL
ncbi:MAG: choice-of-anchor tandem repeat GloVer-containing protein [Bryobacteraceae bacterium]